MTVRKALISDFERIQEIFASAREFMRRSGNPTQWGGARPPSERTLDDISNGVCYVICDGGRTVGVFSFITGDDPTYRSIDGEWLNNLPYGTIHRLASDGSVRGVFSACLEYCSAISKNIRIDTHRDNAPMLRLLSEHGFKLCGTIVTDDGTPRLAFQRTE